MQQIKSYYLFTFLMGINLMFGNKFKLKQIKIIQDLSYFSNLKNNQPVNLPFAFKFVPALIGILI